MKEKFYFVYVLFSLKDKRLYIGYSENLKNRIADHARGKVSSTKNRRPLMLVHYEMFVDKKDAKAKEIFLKSGFGRSEPKKAMKNTLKTLNYRYL